MDDYMDPRQIWTTRDIAMRVHSGFRWTKHTHTHTQAWTCDLVVRPAVFGQDELICIT